MTLMCDKRSGKRKPKHYKHDKEDSLDYFLRMLICELQTESEKKVNDPLSHL